MFNNVSYENNFDWCIPLVTTMKPPPILIGASHCEPPTLCCHATVVVGEFMIVIGGGTTNHKSTKIFGLHLPTHKWYSLGCAGGIKLYKCISPTACNMFVTKKSDSTLHIILHQELLDVVVIYGCSENFTDSGLYIMTTQLLHSRGIICLEKAREDLNEYIPSNRNSHAMFKRKESMIILMGRDKNSNMLSDMWELTLELGENLSNKNKFNYIAHWRQIRYFGDFVPSARYGHSAVYIPDTDRMYMFGGCSTESYKNDLFEFDFITLRWRSLGINNVSSCTPGLKNLPSPRYSQVMWVEKCSLIPPRTCGTSVRRRPKLFALYVHGGDNGYNYFSDTWRLDLTTMRWECVIRNGIGLDGRSGHSIFFVPRKVFYNSEYNSTDDTNVIPVIHGGEMINNKESFAFSSQIFAGVMNKSLHNLHNARDIDRKTCKIEYKFN